MLITRETDYALRILQNLLDGERRSVGEISQKEFIPQQFAYKITKKLAKGGLLAITRGVDGGCRLNRDLETVSLYDLLSIIEGGYEVNACMDPDFTCPRRERGGCSVHPQLLAIQKTLTDQLRSHSLQNILTGR
ncbi:MAG: Rrf2 family transcriptional regulator [Ruminiclostridium sp.]|nr:Rrf2 family transcriptional regulator [Ruminiclostridium sp.]MBQ9933769.1 Rrf2 family transcriptional regulator [Ruminiclostridium sp.]